MLVKDDKIWETSMLDKDRNSREISMLDKDGNFMRYSLMMAINTTPRYCSHATHSCSVFLLN
jgi:hypothetical protein